MGVGALVLADPAEEIEPLLQGGTQEMRRRAGTENLPGIAGFAAAARVALAVLADETRRLAELRKRLEAYIGNHSSAARVFGDEADRVANTSCVAVPGIQARTLVMALDLAASPSAPAPPVRRDGSSRATCCWPWARARSRIPQFASAWGGRPPRPI